jgi:ABC-type nickel/cobalt efflux system permease component RcnA
MSGLDDRLAELGQGSGILIALVVAVLLGLRHATDPDHLTAVSTLVLSDRVAGARRALRLGAAWGLGHGVTLVALGLPVVLVGRSLPDGVHRAAEVGIGLVIAALAVRLLVRWQRGYLHVHEHEHDGVRHAHPHVHEHAGPHGHAHGAHGAAAAPVHAHAHPETLGRTPRAAFAIGLVHGVGGSAAASVLLLGAIASDTGAIAALVLFAVGTALTMAVVSAGVGRALATAAAQRRVASLAPGLGALALLFGAWYAAGGLGVVPYAL